MSKKPMEKPPPSPSSSSSSSYEEDEEDSPPPAISPSNNPSTIFTTKVSQKQQEEEEEEEEEDISGSEEESTEDESSDDSKPVPAKSNPPLQPRDSRPAVVNNQGLNPSLSSDTESEDNEEFDSNPESEPQKPISLPQQSANVSSEDESENSSDSEETAIPSLKPLSSKPMEGGAQHSNKRLATSPPRSSAKKRKIVGFEGKGKKGSTRMVWNKANEMILLQCFVDLNTKHDGSLGQVQMESLLKSLNHSLSSSVTMTQMNDKIRRLKQKYNAIVKSANDGDNVEFCNAQDAVFFDLMKKIWGPSKEKVVSAENNLKEEKVKQSAKEEKVKQSVKEEKVKQIVKEDGQKVNHLVKEYPFLCWHAKNDHANNALVVQSNISAIEAKKLEESCKKLEIAEVQLHIKKMNLMSLGLKLIEDAIEKL